MVRTMVEDLNMIVVKVAGCALGARTHTGGIPKKEWLIATTSARVAARLECECTGNHVHTMLEGGNLTGPSAYYRPRWSQSGR